MRNIILGFLSLLTISCSNVNNVKVKNSSLILALENLISLLESNKEFKLTNKILVFIVEEDERYTIHIKNAGYINCKYVIGENVLAKYPNYNIYYAFNGEKLPDFIQAPRYYECNLPQKYDELLEISRHYVGMYYTFKDGRFEKMKSKL